MATPSYLAASPGRRSQAGLVTQFLGGHGAQWVYAGVLQSQQAAGTAVYRSLASASYSQLVTTGASQTTIGRVAVQVSAVGGSPGSAPFGPLTVSLYAASGGAPAGPALATSTVPEPYVYAQPFWCSVPLQAAGLAPATPYCLVVSGPSPGPGYYAWQCSNQSSGASASPDGSTWTAQAYGLMYQVYDTAAAGRVQAVLADGGARMTAFSYTGGALTGIAEYTAAQDGTALVSSRTLSYSSGTLIGVA